MLSTLEVIKMFLSFSTQKNFRVYQIDVQSTFLNGALEEVYIKYHDYF